MQVLIILLLSCAFSLAVPPSDPPQVSTWSVIWEGQPQDRPTLILLTVDQRDNELIGSYVFNNYYSKKDKAGDVTVEGVRDTNGLFWPCVQLQAKKHNAVDWEGIGASNTPGPRSKILIRKNATSIGLHVRLDLFKPLIGKYEFGRIILSSGQLSEFELKDLSPPRWLSLTGGGK